MIKRKRVAVLGSTGSIGTQTLDVLSNFKDLFEVTRIAGGNNVELIEKQRVECGLTKENARSAYDDIAILRDFASSDDVDIVVNGVVGFAGFKVTLEALKANKTLALANKESLIAGGPLVKKTMTTPGFKGKIIPVDSDHSAILRCLKSRDKREADAIVVTASGCRFSRRHAERLANVDRE